MRRFAMCVVSLSGIVLLVSPVAQGCGDKLLALGRGVRFQRAFAASRPASILIYAARNSGGALANNAELQLALKQVGHKVQAVEDSGSFHQILSTGKFDLVMTDFTDAAGLTQEAQAAPSRPTLLPVMYKPDKLALAAAAKQYSLVLKTPGKFTEYLAAIDEIMKRRATVAHT